MKKCGYHHEMQDPAPLSEHLKKGYRKWPIVLSDGSTLVVQSKDEELLARRLCDSGYTVTGPPDSIRCFRFYPKLGFKKHGYYHPDFFVYDRNSGNLLWVIEVKSKFTLTNDLLLNRDKFRAANRYCRRLGISFYLCVYISADDKFDRIEFPKMSTFRHHLI